MVAEMLRLLKHDSSGVETKCSTVGCVYGPGATSLPGSEGSQTWLQDQSAQDLSEVLGYRGKMLHRNSCLEGWSSSSQLYTEEAVSPGKEAGVLVFLRISSWVKPTSS